MFRCSFNKLSVTASLNPFAGKLSFFKGRGRVIARLADGISPFDAEFRQIFIKRLMGMYPKAVETLWPWWRAKLPAMSDEKRCRIAVALTVRREPGPTVFFYLSLLRHAPESAEFFRSLAQSYIGTTDHDIVEYLLSDTMRTPRHNGWMYGFNRTAFVFMEAVSTKCLSVDELFIRAGSELYGPLTDRVDDVCEAVEELVERENLEVCGPTSADSFIPLADGFREAAARNMKFSTPFRKLLVFLAGRIKNGEEADRLRAFNWVLREQEALDELFKSCCTRSLDVVNACAEKLWDSAENTKIRLELLRGIPEIFLWNFIETLEKSAKPSSGYAGGKLLSDKASAFMAAVSPDGKRVQDWNRTPPDFLKAISVRSDNSLWKIASAFSNEWWRAAVCETEGLPSETPWSEMNPGTLFAYQPIVPNFYYLIREVILREGAAATLALAFEKPKDSAEAYRLALTTPAVRRDALMQMGSAEWRAAGGFELHRSYEVTDDKMHRVIRKGLLSDFKEALELARSRQEISRIVSVYDLRADEKYDVWKPYRPCQLIREYLAEGKVQWEDIKSHVPPPIRDVLSCERRTPDEVKRDILERRTDGYPAFKGYAGMLARKNSVDRFDDETKAFIKLLWSEPAVAATPALAATIPAEVLKTAIVEAAAVLRENFKFDAAGLELLNMLGLEEASDLNAVLKQYDAKAPEGKRFDALYCSSSSKKTGAGRRLGAPKAALRRLQQAILEKLIANLETRTDPFSSVMNAAGADMFSLVFQALSRDFGGKLHPETVFLITELCFGNGELHKMAPTSAAILARLVPHSDGVSHQYEKEPSVADCCGVEGSMTAGCPGAPTGGSDRLTAVQPYE